MPAPENTVTSTLVLGTGFLAELRWGEVVYVSIGLLIFILTIGGFVALVIYGLRPGGAHSHQFRLPRKPRSLPRCRFRPYASSDFDACMEIYSLNAPGRFPEGHEGEFSDVLRGGTKCMLVLEIEGKVCGFGGIGIHPRATNYASLFYGMIHPSQHRKGLGTALLLARISLLPDRDDEWVASMQAVRKSAGFYRRFGFHGEQGVDQCGLEVHHLWAVVDAQGLSEIRQALARSGIEVQAPMLRIQHPLAGG